MHKLPKPKEKMNLTYRRKKTLAVVACLFALFLIFASWYFYDRFSYAKPLPMYSVSKAKDSVLTIGIIGDSWVFEKKLDSFLKSDLLKNTVNARIISCGHPGAKTKIIYQNLFADNLSANSSKFIIENRPDYCIVVTGVNDAIAQIDDQNYAYHVQQIIKTLLHYKIKPLVVSMPQFGVGETINDLDYFSKTRNTLTAHYNNDGELNSIETYRKALLQDLLVSQLKDSIILINFDKITPDYSKNPEYYLNASHLNAKGNQQLSRVISNELIKQIQNL